MISIIDWASLVVDWLLASDLLFAEIVGSWRIISSCSSAFWISFFTNLSITQKASSSVLFWRERASVLMKRFSFFMILWCFMISCIALFLSSGENFTSWFEILLSKLWLFSKLPSFISVLEGLIKFFSPSPIMRYSGLKMFIFSFAFLVVDWWILDLFV